MKFMYESFGERYILKHELHRVQLWRIYPFKLCGIVYRIAAYAIYTKELRLYPDGVSPGITIKQCNPFYKDIQLFKLSPYGGGK